MSKSRRRTYRNPTPGQLAVLTRMSANGATQAEIAAELDVSQSKVARWRKLFSVAHVGRAERTKENNARRRPTPETLSRLRELSAMGLTNNAIAIELRRSASAVSRWRRAL
ncbi:MAG: helix-turn-helix domain-containing protein [Patescibacteria group bacterium]|nr:helix-turn-helix domain-containing protein [Patescibacteria group bacterium]